MGKYSIRNLLRFTDRGSSSLANSMLDYIMSHDQIDQDFTLYQLANYRKRGTIIDSCYEKEGLQRLVSENLPRYMYRNGKGQFMDEQQLNAYQRGRIEDIQINLENHSGKGRFVCWKLEDRGMLGESLLHVLVICNTEVHSYIAKYLIELYPSLAKDIIEGEEYYGASALHFAIANENEVLIKLLIEAGASVDQRARGTFFLPADQQWPVPRKETNFEGLSYLGEYPLAWAACWDDESTYNLLLKHGADPQAQDTFGNNVLHVVVVRDRLKMYGYALRHPVKPASDRLYNKYGLTPLTLACKLGRNKIFTEMLEFSSLEFWRYSNITCSGYPLNALDSLHPTGQTNLNSALMIILNGNKPEHLDMLEGGVIQRLLEEKWKTFAQRCFYNRLMLMLLHLFNLSVAIFLRPSVKQPLLGLTDAYSIVRYCAEIGVCIGCIGIAIFQQVQEVLAQGFFHYAVALVSSPSKTAFVISCFLILSCIPCRMIGDRKTEDILLVIAIPLTWLFLVFFAGAVRLTGPFVTMIYSMLVGDMIRFGIIYIIFLCAFTQAFYFLFKHPVCSTKVDLKKRFSTFSVTWMGLFQMTLGAYEYEDFRETYYKKLTQVVFTTFMVFTPILLLNMLIAMMGNTYCQVIIESEKEWVKQWAKIVVVLERAIKRRAAKEFIEIYSIKMPPDEKNNEVRGVIVIKRKKKSKAKEKKQALSLWKRLGRRTVQELRKAGGSAAVVRKRYNLFQPKQSALALPACIKDLHNSTQNIEKNKSVNQDSSVIAQGKNIGLDSNGFGGLLSCVTKTPSLDCSVINSNTHQEQPENFNETVPLSILSANYEQQGRTIVPPPPYSLSSNTTEFGYENRAFFLEEIPSTIHSNGPTVNFNADYITQSNENVGELTISVNDSAANERIFKKNENLLKNIDDSKQVDVLMSKNRKHHEKSKRKRRKLFRKACVEDVRPQTTEDSSDEQRICVNIETKVIRRSKKTKNTSNNKQDDLSIIEESSETLDTKARRKYENPYQSLTEGENTAFDNEIQLPSRLQRRSCKNDTPEGSTSNDNYQQFGYPLIASESKDLEGETEGPTLTTPSSPVKAWVTDSSGKDEKK